MLNDSRLEIGMERILALLDDHQTKARFFVLGAVAERNPNPGENVGEGRTRNRVPRFRPPIRLPAVAGGVQGGHPSARPGDRRLDRCRPARLSDPILLHSAGLCLDVGHPCGGGLFLRQQRISRSQRPVRDAGCSSLSARNPYEASDLALRMVKRLMVPFTDHYVSVSRHIMDRAISTGIGRPEHHSVVYGYLIPPRDLDFLTERLLDLVQHPELRKRLGGVHRQNVQKKFSGDEMVRILDKRHREVLAVRRGSAARS